MNVERKSIFEDNSLLMNYYREVMSENRHVSTLLQDQFKFIVGVLFSLFSLMATIIMIGNHLKINNLHLWVLPFVFMTSIISIVGYFVIKRSWKISLIWIATLIKLESILGLNREFKDQKPWDALKDDDYLLYKKYFESVKREYTTTKKFIEKTHIVRFRNPNLLTLCWIISILSIIASIFIVCFVCLYIS